MPDKLPFAPAHRAGEAPASYASRIAFAHGLTVRELCSDFKIGYHELINGERTAVARIAALGAARAEDLASFAFVRTGPREFSHRGQALHTDCMVHGKLNFCPRCLAEDAEVTNGRPSGAAYFCRVEWLLDVVDTCPVHLTALTTIAAPGNNIFGTEFPHRLAAHAIDLERMTAELNERSPTDLQTYALGRLAGISRPVTFLDAMPLFAAIETCEILGTAARFGNRAKHSGLAPAPLREARIHGFEIASRGEAGVRELLGRMALSYAQRFEAKDRLARQAFAAMYIHLHVRPGRHSARDEAMRLLRQTVSDFIKTNFPLKPGDNVLGEIIGTRMLHSVTSLAKEARCGPDRVRKVLTLGGLIRDDQAGLSNATTLFDAELGARMLQESRSALSYDEAAAYLQTASYQVKMFAKANLIELTKAARHGQHGTVHVATLDAFTQRLLKGAQPAKRKTGTMALLSEASRRAMCTEADIVKLVVAERLQHVQTLEGQAPYRSILVDWREVRSIIHGVDPATLSLREFADRIGVRKQAAGALAAYGHVSAVATTCGGHRTLRIKVPDATTFQQTFVSLGELASSRDQHHQTTKKTLDERGLRPAFDPDAFHAHIYRRADLR